MDSMTATSSQQAINITDALTLPDLKWEERLLARMLKDIRFGRMHLTLPTGRSFVVDGRDPGPACNVRIKSNRVIGRMMRGGDLGLAEGYLADEWETDNLSAFLMFGQVNEKALGKATKPSLLIRCMSRIGHALNANSRRGSRRNIAAHYDLGNDFYRLWLDDTMTYSAAVFADDDKDMNEDLEAAQLRKYRRLADSLNLKPGAKVLEIGCGWGGFAEVAARDYGCDVVCLTLSKEQAAFAESRMVDLGLSDQVEIRLQDYRDVTGTFDAIASIEMFEAVGEAYWPTYMQTLHARLKSGGKAALQIITIDDEAFEGYRTTPDFIQRYIFPGGMLPPPGRLEEETRRVGLRITDSFFFGASYAETLRRWDQTFENRWAAVRALGFDERFRRMWRYYLAYCEVGFDSGRIDVGHFLIEHD